jgi:ABC-type nitrate/sulfonate/bicarbonate transport system ATPase subunit
MTSYASAASLPNYSHATGVESATHDNVAGEDDINEALYMSDRIAIMTPRPGRTERVIHVPLERRTQTGKSN